MVLVSPALNPKACWEFEGDILVLHHPTTISPRYQAMGKFRSLRLIEVKMCVYWQQCIQFNGNNFHIIWSCPLKINNAVSK